MVVVVDAEGEAAEVAVEAEDLAVVVVDFHLRQVCRAVLAWRLGRVLVVEFRGQVVQPRGHGLAAVLLLDRGPAGVFRVAE